MQQLDPPGVGARDLRECLLWQIEAQRRESQIAAQRPVNGNGVNGNGEVLKVLDMRRDDCGGTSAAVAAQATCVRLRG